MVHTIKQGEIIIGTFISPTTLLRTLKQHGHINQIVIIILFANLQNQFKLLINYLNPCAIFLIIKQVHYLFD